MQNLSSTQISRRQFIGAGAGAAAWVGIGARLPLGGATVAPSFFNCDAQFFHRLATFDHPLRATLFLTNAELRHLEAVSLSGVEIEYRPATPNVNADYAKWVRRRGKPTFAFVEQGALWAKLARLCAWEGIVLLEWERVSGGFSADSQTPLFNAATVDLATLCADAPRTASLTRHATRCLVPLVA